MAGLGEVIFNSRHFDFAQRAERTHPVTKQVEVS
jgi:hypothetical protein